MKIEKVLNNTVVVALDENGAETVLMGRGLGFGRRAGDEAPPDKVEKRFTLHSDQLSDRFQQLITSIPLPHFLMSERIINHAKIALGKELSDSIYVTLPDHISAAVNRYKEGIVLPNPLLWDIRQLYKDEFRVGLKANEIVKEETGVEFTDDEAAFIALHFVNAQLGGEIRDIYDMTYLLQAVFRIVYDEYGFRPDDESLNYYRFVTHLKFYARRIVSGEGYGDEDSDSSKDGYDYGIDDSESSTSSDGNVVDANAIFVDKVVALCQKQVSNLRFSGKTVTVTLEIRQTDEGELQLDTNQLDTIDRTVLQFQKSN